MTAPGRPEDGAAPPAEAAIAATLLRAAVYRLLGRAFAYPATSGVADLAGQAEAASRHPSCPPPVREPLDRLAAAARGVDAAALADEHVFLFDRQVPCPPYEGAYGPSDPMAAGKAAALADVEGFYLAFGLTPSADRPDAADHLGAELEFMSVLALKEAYALAEGEGGERLSVTREAATRFLTDHLGRWADAFAETLRTATALPFHLAAADLLAAWVAEEVRALGATPSPLGPPGGRGAAEGDTFACPMAAAEGEAPLAPTEAT